MTGNNGANHTDHPVLRILQALQIDTDFLRALESDIDHLPEFLEKYAVTQSDALLALKILNFTKQNQSAENIASDPTPAEDEEERKLRLQLRQGLVDGLLAVIREIDKGYAKVMWMYLVTFYVGIAFLLVSLGASLWIGADASTYLLGGLGVSGVVSMLIFKPTESLQRSRSKLAQLQALFIGWLNDSYNWNRYWETIINADLLRKRQPPDFAKVNEVSEIQILHTKEMMELIQQYSDPVPTGDEARQPPPK